MKNFYRDETTGKLEALPGSSITHAIDEAKELAGEGAVCFEFNGLAVTVRADTDMPLLCRDYLRALKGSIGKEIGPYPKVELSETELAHERSVDAEIEQRRQVAQAEYDQRQAEKERELAALLATAPPMEFSDEAGWRKTVDANSDGYGGAVITYAERGARLMQKAVAEGKTIPEVASALSHGADVEGITGFQYGCAVSILSQTWKHGEELRRWHNLDRQIGTEGEKANEAGGVLNPALLSFEAPANA